MVAKCAGITESSISHYKAGAVPNYEVILEISFYFGISPFYFRRSEHRTPAEFYKLGESFRMSRLFTGLSIEDQKMFRKLVRGWKVEKTLDKEEVQYQEEVF